jgi:phage terminase Nu1 subunit (DNA packaging protein)
MVLEVMADSSSKLFELFPDRITASELSAVYGCKYDNIKHLRLEGMPCLEERGRGNRVLYKFPDSINWYIAKLKGRDVDHRANLAKAQTEKVEIANKKALGILVDKELMRIEIAKVFKFYRQAMLSFANRFSLDLAQTTEPKDVKRFLDAEFREIINQCLEMVEVLDDGLS